MKKSSLELTLRTFYSNMDMDATFLTKIEKTRQVVKSLDERREVFGAYVFKICVNWEILVEALLIDCLNKDTTRYRKWTGFKISKNITRDTCKAIILGTGYIDWKGVSNLKNLAKNILVSQHNPFKEIPTRPNGDRIEEFFVLRNYLAHYSDAARRSLHKKYKDRYSLQSFSEPGQFLLAKDRRTKIPRIRVYINNFMDTADIMVKFLKIDTN